MSSTGTPRFMYLGASFSPVSATDFPPVFAAFHPGAEPKRKRAVLLCPPFGWEDMCSYRSRRDWAEHLAQEGYSTLRFDFPGSGDSAGDPTDPGQLDAWARAVVAAAGWLAAASAGAEIVAAGIGLGGMIACRAVLAGAPIAELVLWHVPSRGRALVRELRAFAALEVAYIEDPDATRADAQPQPLEAGALVANGYLMSAETVAALQRLDLGALPSAPGAPRRVLLLGRDGLKVDERLHDALARAGAAVTVADGPGYGAMTVEPQEARAPTAVFELVDSWLQEGEQRPVGGDAEHAAAAHTAADPAPSSSTGEHEQLRLRHNGVELREQPLTLETPDGPLFGILSEPLGARADLCAVLINAGAQRRTGPNRMWVEIARRWAARGVPTLRFDLAGIGDSDGDSAKLVQVAAIYAQTYGRQARAALDALAARGLPERFVVLGLCAGGYWSLHTALADERAGTVVMLNPRSLIWDEGVYGARRVRELRERLLLASTWRKAIRGELNLARHMETARAVARRATRSRALTRGQLGGSAPPPVDRSALLASVFDRLRDRDQHALLLFTGSEPLHDELASKGLLDDARPRWPNLEIAIRGTSADTHTLTPLWLQRQVHELVDRALERESQRLRAGTRP
jgi:alpha-beta hydrolase superfamily lysophospholipase